jgi:hypothetical protein
MAAGETYCEIDDAAFPSGEIRGQLSLSSPVPALPAGAPEVLALALIGAGLLVAGRASRARQLGSQTSEAGGGR